MEDDSYPVLVGSANMPDDITHTPVALSVDGDAVCDITGRRVLNSQLKRGIYIIGGKKVLFR